CVKGIMADINVQGQVEQLMLVWQTSEWRELWESLHLSYFTFPDLGLDPSASDLLVWQRCRTNDVVLITGNRNKDGPDSLQATLEQHNTADCLPVFTLANIHRFDHEPSYVARVAVRLLDYFLDIDRVRGTGRLYVP